MYRHGRTKVLNVFKPIAHWSPRRLVISFCKLPQTSGASASLAPPVCFPWSINIVHWTMTTVPSFGDQGPSHHDNGGSSPGRRMEAQLFLPPSFERPAVPILVWFTRGATVAGADTQKQNFLGLGNQMLSVHLFY